MLCSKRLYYVENGRLYTCTLIPNIEHFNKYFNKNLEVCDDDSIDIYKAKIKKKFLIFLPIQFHFVDIAIRI